MILKWTFIIIGITLFLFLSYILVIIYPYRELFVHHTEKELIHNYKAKTKEIYELKNYINSIVPANKSVEIEFENNQTFFIFHIVDNGNYDSNWDLKVDSKKTDTLLHKLGWTRQILSTLKDKLDKANCISVSSGEPCNIGWQRSGIGEYSYDIFDKPIPDSLKKNYNDSCQYILFNDKVVLEYGGGAIGPDCFPDNTK